MRRLAYRIGRIVGAILRRLRPAPVDLLPVPAPVQPTTAQRVERVRLAADLRERHGFAELDIEEWNTDYYWWAAREGADL